MDPLFSGDRCDSAHSEMCMFVLKKEIRTKNDVTFQLLSACVGKSKVVGSWTVSTVC